MIKSCHNFNGSTTTRGPCWSIIFVLSVRNRKFVIESSKNNDDGRNRDGKGTGIRFVKRPVTTPVLRAIITLSPDTFDNDDNDKPIITLFIYGP